MNLILRLSSPANSRSGTTPNRSESQNIRESSGAVVASLYHAARSASGASLWKQVAFTHVNLADGETDKEMFDTIAKALYTLLDKRKMYNMFYSADSVISIPEAESSRLRENSRYFDYLIRPLQSAAELHPDLLLGVLLEQVCILVCPQENPNERTVGHLSRKEDIALLKDYVQRATNYLTQWVAAEVPDSNTGSFPIVRTTHGSDM